MSETDHGHRLKYQWYDPNNPRPDKEGLPRPAIEISAYVHKDDPRACARMAWQLEEAVISMIHELRKGDT